jgi:hypothetical protein
VDSGLTNEHKNRQPNRLPPSGVCNLATRSDAKHFASQHTTGSPRSQTRISPSRTKTWLQLATYAHPLQPRDGRKGLSYGTIPSQMTAVDTTDSTGATLCRAAAAIMQGSREPMQSCCSDNARAYRPRVELLQSTQETCRAATAT